MKGGIVMMFHFAYVMYMVMMDDMLER